jgi:hypothetical protein
LERGTGLPAEGQFGPQAGGEVMKYFLFLLGLVILIGAEIARVYFIMPFPGSQKKEVLSIAYFLHQHILYFRLAGILLVAYPAYLLIRSKPVVRYTTIALMIFWLMVFYAFNFRFMADKMFYEPKKKVMVRAGHNKVDKKNLVLGVVINQQAAAYPIEIIGYHHQVRDTVGGGPIMVTYCTVCRTGRVYNPQVNGKAETFRLVGMDHFNAMFEDRTTQSWWRQVNGEAVAGPLKGNFLQEIFSEQMTLEAWLARHPDSFILQPDSAFLEQYKDLEKFDEGKMSGSLERTDSLSWREKSWVVGVTIGGQSRAYDWNDVKSLRVINDELNGVPLTVVLQDDTASFHVWNRIIKGDTLQFYYNEGKIRDVKTGSWWDWAGRCIDGYYRDAALQPIQAYQEFWHSWRTFHPATSQYVPPYASVK